MSVPGPGRSRVPARRPCGADGVPEPGRLRRGASAGSRAGPPSCALCPVPCALCPAPCALCPAPCVLRPASCVLRRSVPWLSVGSACLCCGPAPGGGVRRGGGGLRPCVPWPCALQQSASRPPRASSPLCLPWPRALRLGRRGRPGPAPECGRGRPGPLVCAVAAPGAGRRALGPWARPPGLRPPPASEGSAARFRSSPAHPPVRSPSSASGCPRLVPGGMPWR